MINYRQLQDLYERLNSRGFVVLAFPSNQFGRQEPGTDEEIKQFVRNTLSVTFPLFAKIKVNGENAHPIFKFLRHALPGQLGNLIKWNFTKFLVDRQGVPVKRFAPSTKPLAIEPYILKLLDQN